MANEFIARKGLIALDNSGISGSLDVSGSLTIESSGSTIFEVIGSEGQLFSITDNLSGSLFAVSDVSGLPILEVFSDDTVKIGSFNNEGLIVGGTNVTASNLLASDVTISHTPSSSPTSLVIGNPPHLVHTIEIASGSTNVMRFASNTGNGGQHTIGFSGHTGANSMQTAIIGKADGASGRVDLYFALTSGDNTTATTSDAVLRLDHNDVNFYQKVHANDDTFEIGGSNTGDSILYLGAEKRTGIARDYRGAGNAADFVVMTMGSLGGTSVPATHTRLRVTKEGDTEISGSVTASQNVDIQGTLSLPGFTNVSASLASAVAGGDNLGNHIATQDLNMGGNNITSVGNVDGRDLSTDGTKLDGIEASADVTDTANVTAAGALMDSELSEIATVKALTAAGISGSFNAASASFSTRVTANDAKLTANTSNVQAAGALMDSEVTNLAQVKAFDSSDYATAAQGTKADTAIQPADTGSFLTTVDISSDTNLAAGTGITLTGDTLSTNDSEIDHDSLSNFSADEHFTQANITTVGTVTSGDISAILPSGIVSGSAQTVANLDGQNVTVNRLTVKNSVDHLKLQNSAGTVTYVNFSPQGGLEIDLGGAGNSISASQNIKTHGDFIGESTHIKLIGPDGGGGSFTYLSSSGDPAAGGFKLSLGDLDGIGNTTTLIIDDIAEQISLSKALSVTGNITVTGNVDGVNIASLENSVQANDTEIASLTAATSSYLTSVPAGTISSSAQVDHDATTNFSADEHFTQANITTVGTVTSGDISAILPAGTVSSSAQITGFVDTTGTPAATAVAVFTDADTVEGTSGLAYDGTTLDIDGATAGSGVKIYGGVVGAANPYISPAGAHSTLFLGDSATGNVIDLRNNKLSFDSDATNTYIQADTDTPENLEIHADGNIELRADNDLQVFSNIDVNNNNITNVGTVDGVDISNLERLSKGRITFLYTGSVDYAPPGYIAFLDQATDNIIINTSSYNGVDLDASVANNYSKFQFNEAGSLITIRKVSDGSFKTYKIITATTNYTGNADNVGYLVDGGSFANVMESGSISDGDEVEFIWDKSAGVGGAYGPTVNASAKTFAGLFQGGYNYLDMFFGTATDTEFDGDPENLSGVTVSSSFTDSSYFLPAISQSATLTLGGLTVNGTITGTINTSSITDFPTEVSRSAAAAGFGSGGGGAATTYRANHNSSAFYGQTDKRYMPFNSTGESTGFNYLTIVPAAADGKLVQITIWPQTSVTNLILGFHKNSNATPSAEVSQAVTIGTPITFDFTTGNTFSKHDELSFSVSSSNNPNGISAEIILEYDL